MTGSDVARRSHSDQAERGTARMRFVDALVQLRQGIAHVREAVHFATEGIFEILVGEYVELCEYIIHPAVVDGIEPIRRSGDRREADFVEAEIILQVTEDADYVGNARSQGDSCGDRPRAMILNQVPHSGLDDIVAPAPIREDSEQI